MFLNLKVESLSVASENCLSFDCQVIMALTHIFNLNDICDIGTWTLSEYHCLVTALITVRRNKMQMAMTVLCDIAPCSLVDVYRRFGGFIVLMTIVVGASETSVYLNDTD
jgi:hypothetical protein